MVQALLEVTFFAEFILHSAIIARMIYFRENSFDATGLNT